MCDGFLDPCCARRARCVRDNAYIRNPGINYSSYVQASYHKGNHEVSILILNFSLGFGIGLYLLLLKASPLSLLNFSTPNYRLKRVLDFSISQKGTY
jgi:hypothetical protein